MRITPEGLVGLGIGLIIGAMLMGFSIADEMTAGEIELAAREMGMIYPQERTVIEALSEEGSK